MGKSISLVDREYVCSDTQYASHQGQIQELEVVFFWGKGIANQPIRASLQIEVYESHKYPEFFTRKNNRIIASSEDEDSNPSEAKVIVFLKSQSCEFFHNSSQSNLCFFRDNPETTQNSCENIFQELEDILTENRDEVDNLVLLGDEDIDIEEFDSVASQQINEMICEKYLDSAYDIYF